MMASAALDLESSPDFEDDRLVDLGEEVVVAARHKDGGADKVCPSRDDGYRAMGSGDLSPGTTHRRLVEEALKSSAWQLSERNGGIRPPEFLPGGGIANPLGCFAECGDPMCGCNRLKNPGVRGSFAELILDNAAHEADPATDRVAGSSFRDFMKTRRLVYATIGCGLLWFDFDVVRRLRGRGVSIGTVVLVDECYADPTHYSHDAVRARATGQRRRCRPFREA